MRTFHDSVEAGSEDEVQLMLKEGLVDLESRAASGLSVLQIAAHKGHSKIVELLISAGASVAARQLMFDADKNVRKLLGPTALHFAASGGHLEVTKQLLKHSDVDINAACDRKVYRMQYPLLSAAAGASPGHEAVALLLLAQGAQISPLHATTVLHLAARNNHYKLIQRALDLGLDIDIKDRLGHTPLHYIIYASSAKAKVSDLTTACLLIDRGADVNAKTSADWCPVHFAAEAGDVQMLELLVLNGADPQAECTYSIYKKPETLIGGLNMMQVNILHIAAITGNFKVAEKALELGVNVHHFTTAGCNALHLAAIFGEGTAVLELLLPQIEDVDVHCTFSWLPWFQEKPEMGTNATALHLACIALTPAILVLIEAGANVNARTNNGNTPLHYICGREENNNLYRKEESLTRAVRALIAAGASVNAPNDYAITPLHLACWFNNAEAISVLIECGADVHARCSTPDSIQTRGNFSAAGTPLHFSIWGVENRKKTIQLLKAADAHLNARDAEGDTPLHHLMWPKRAARMRYSGTAASSPPKTLGQVQTYRLIFETTKDLIEAGADVCDKNNQGVTPMQRLTGIYRACSGLESPPQVFSKEVESKVCRIVHDICVSLVSSGDFSWEALPHPCHGLERALVPVWQKKPEELRNLFNCLEHEIKGRICQTLRCLHHNNISEDLRMKILGAAFT